MDREVPITSHPALPNEIPLIGSFHDDRNRLSHYYPRLRSLSDVRVPLTRFIPVDGSYDSFPDIEYRDATRFMQNISARKAFVRGDYSSAKYDGDTGSKIESQDPYDIETVVLEMLRQLGRGKRRLGGRIAIREWIPHDIEVRCFIRDGSVVYGLSADGEHSVDDYDSLAASIEAVADHFSELAWSADFIRHRDTGKFYCIDMGLDGLYHTGSEWIPMSEHTDPSYSPGQYTETLPKPSRFDHSR